MVSGSGTDAALSGAVHATKYQAQSAQLMGTALAAGGEEAAVIRQKLRVRMTDVSEFMKAVKQRFSVV